MKKLLGLFLVAVLFFSCTDNDIDVKQSKGSWRTIDYGEFILNLETTKYKVVEEKFFERRDLKGTVLVDSWFDNKITIPVYFYIIRVSNGKDNSFYDIYVPKGFYDTWDVGDTISSLVKTP